MLTHQQHRTDGPRVVPSLADRWSHHTGGTRLKVVPCHWRATVPCAGAEGLELAEVGLPQPVPSCRRHDEGSRRTPASWRTSLV